MSFLIRKALDHYDNRNYYTIDVPYYVDQDVTACTKPDWVEDTMHSETKAYVGSGEQSFIQMMKDRMLRNGKSMCITPCFRDEPVLDDLHLKMFLKLELIEFQRRWEDRNNFMQEHLLQLQLMMKDAFDFFKAWAPDQSTVIIEKSDVNQYDILVNGIEVGSYGWRETEFGRYIYGTGLALPRFEYVRYKRGE